MKNKKITRISKLSLPDRQLLENISQEVLFASRREVTIMESQKKNR